MTTLEPIATAPRDGTYILLFGPSGYVTTPLRCEVGCFSKTRAERDEKMGWRTHSSDSFLESGEAPTHWCHIPKVKEDSSIVPYGEANLDRLEKATLLDGAIVECGEERKVEVWRVKEESGYCVRIFRPTNDGKTSKLVFGLKPPAANALMIALSRHLPKLASADQSPPSPGLQDTDKMPFGEYRGKLMQDVPVNYLHWLWNNGRREDQTCPVAEYIRRNLAALKKENSDLIWS